ncbi:unnamed protein product [Trichobilharzia szidati]|nr:unnamed protein product [Trichobilharzia szidati]
MHFETAVCACEKCQKRVPLACQWTENDNPGSLASSSTADTGIDCSQNTSPLYPPVQSPHTITHRHMGRKYGYPVGHVASSSSDDHPPPVPPKTADIPPLPPKHISGPVRQLNASHSADLVETCAICRRNATDINRPCTNTKFFDKQSVNAPRQSPFSLKCETTHTGCPSHSQFSDSLVRIHCSSRKTGLNKSDKELSGGSSHSHSLGVSKSISDAKVTQSATCKRFEKKHVCSSSKYRTENMCELMRDSNSTSDLPTSSCTCSSNLWGSNVLASKVDSECTSHPRCFSSEYRGLNLISNHFVNRKVSSYRKDLGNMNKTGCGSLQWISETFQRIFLVSKNSKAKNQFPQSSNDMFPVPRSPSSSNEDKISGRVKTLIQKKDREWRRDICNQRPRRSLPLRHKRSLSYNNNCTEGTKVSPSNSNECETSSFSHPPVNHHSLPPRSATSRSSAVKCINSAVTPDTTKKHSNRLDSLSPSSSRVRPIHTSKTVGLIPTRYQTSKLSNMCMNYKRPESALAMMCACPSYVSSQANCDAVNPNTSRLPCETSTDPNNVLKCTEDIDFGEHPTTIIDKNGQIHHVHHIHHFHHVHHHHHHHDCTDVANNVASCPLSPVTSPVVCDRQRPPTTIASAMDTCILEETSVSSPLSCQNANNQPPVCTDQITPVTSCHTYNAYDVRASDSINMSVSTNSASRDSRSASIRRLSSTLQDSRSSFHRSMLELRKMGWYWGPLSFQEAQFLLAKRPDGSFLVRDSGHDTHILSLSFRVRGETYHTRIEHNQGRFSFWSQPQSHSANTMVEFIEKAVAHSVNGQFHYFLQSSAQGQPPVEVPLLYPLSRFQVVASLRHLTRFTILSYIRRDHIDQLPLPRTTINYLLEKQCYIESLEDFEEAVRDRPPLEFRSRSAIDFNSHISMRDSSGNLSRHSNTSNGSSASEDRSGESHITVRQNS